VITADTLKTLTTFTAPALAKALDVSGYSMQAFKSAKFLGITNGGQFCYRVEYYDEDGRGRTWDKVFLTYNPAEGRVSADFG
jgi:hypothetical protein